MFEAYIFAALYQSPNRFTARKAVHCLSILETIQRAEKEAVALKRDAAQKAQRTLGDARAKADEAKAARVKSALENADKKLEVTDELAKARLLRGLCR